MMATLHTFLGAPALREKRFSPLCVGSRCCLAAIPSLSGSLVEQASHNLFPYPGVYTMPSPKHKTYALNPKLPHTGPLAAPQADDVCGCLGG